MPILVMPFCDFFATHPISAHDTLVGFDTQFDHNHWCSGESVSLGQDWPQLGPYNLAIQLILGLTTQGAVGLRQGTDSCPLKPLRHGVCES